jgi:hypothetical protein
MPDVELALAAIQSRLALLQETADRRIALRSNCNFVGTARFDAIASTCQQLRPRGPVWLVFGETRIVCGIILRYYHDVRARAIWTPGVYADRFPS